MPLGDGSKKYDLIGGRSRRKLESQSGAMRRAARRLRRKGYAKASEEMALQAEQQRLGEKAEQGSGFRSAEAATAMRDINDRRSKTERALAAGFRPPTKPASGRLLEQRKSLFEEMKAARQGGQDVEGFRDRATALGVTSSGFESALGKLPPAGGTTTPPAGGTTTPVVKPNTPTSTTPVPPEPTAPAGPNAPGGTSPVQNATPPPPETTSPTASRATPPAAGPTSPPAKPAAGDTAKRVARINGLTPSVATEIAADYADVDARVQSLIAEGAKSGLTYSPEEREEAAAGFRRMRHKRSREAILKDLRENDPTTADQFDKFYENSLAIDPDTDPREVLHFIREKQQEERVNPSPTTFDLKPATERAGILLDVMKQIRELPL